MSDFVFVFLDDCSLDVVDIDSNMNGAYEGIDVENGEYAFFDSKLRKLIPTFTTPNGSGRILGIRWASSGTYILETSEYGPDEFMNRLQRVSVLNASRWFKRIEEVSDYVRSL